MTEFLHGATVSEHASLRRACLWALGEFCQHAEVDFSDYNGNIAVALLDRFFDEDPNVLMAANVALTQLNKRVPAEELCKDLAQIRTSISSAISRAKYKGGAASANEQYYVPGFCIKKGLAPVLPVFQHGLIYGNVETRESAAAGLGEVIKVATNDAVKPFLMKITGPLIRVVGDRFPVRFIVFGPSLNVCVCGFPSFAAHLTQNTAAHPRFLLLWLAVTLVQAPVKIETLRTILLLLNKGGKRLRPFIPQLQTTFVKNLSDASHVVRNLSARALTRLMEFVVRVDQLVTELKNGIVGAVGGVQQAMMRAVKGVLDVKGEKVSAGLLQDLRDILVPKLSEAATETRDEAGRLLGVLSLRLAPAAGGAALVEDTLCGAGAQVPGNGWESKYAATQALSSLLQSAGEEHKQSDGALLSEASTTFRKVLQTIEGLSRDDNGTVREGACAASSALVVAYSAGPSGSDLDEAKSAGGTTGELPASKIAGYGAKLLVKACKDRSTDVRTAACAGIKAVCRKSTGYFATPALQTALLGALAGCAQDRKNARLRVAADKALFYALRLDDLEGAAGGNQGVKDTIKRMLDGELAAFLIKHWPKVARTITADIDED